MNKEPIKALNPFSGMDPEEYPNAHNESLPLWVRLMSKAQQEDFDRRVFANLKSAGAGNPAAELTPAAPPSLR